MRLAVAVLVLALGPGIVRAECAPPEIVAAPPAGSAVPPDAVIFLFETPPQIAIRVVDEAGRELAFDREPVAADGRRYGERLAIHGGDASRIVVEHGEERIEYSVSRCWTRPSEPVTVRSSAMVRDRWMCGETDAHELELGGAPAYRIEWSATREGLDALGAYAGIFAGPRAQLGARSCRLPTASPASQQPERWLRVTGLYPDGSEVPAAEPILVGGPTPLPDPGMAGGQLRAETGAPDPRVRYAALGAGIAIFAAALVAGARRLRRARRGHGGGVATTP